ncbi:MAG TPA: response regulator [Candidatus Saccharimonas sp.]|nr:response regulator [Candidatus Saccharimonas sp.]
MAHVLIIEDDTWMADCYRRWLTADGHTVRCVGDAQSALDALDDAPADVVLLDLLLPHANGTQVLHTLQSYADLARMPVILCSSSLPPQLPPLRAYGVRAVLDKTQLTPNLLRQTVAEVLAHATI